MKIKLTGKKIEMFKRCGGCDKDMDEGWKHCPECGSPNAMFVITLDGKEYVEREKKNNA